MFEFQAKAPSSFSSLLFSVLSLLLSLSLSNVVARSGVILQTSTCLILTSKKCWYPLEAQLTRFIFLHLLELTKDFARFDKLFCPKKASFHRSTPALGLCREEEKEKGNGRLCRGNSGETQTGRRETETETETGVEAERERQRQRGGLEICIL